jgi:hypothetical protein
MAGVQLVFAVAGWFVLTRENGGGCCGGGGGDGGDDDDDDSLTHVCDSLLTRVELFLSVCCCVQASGSYTTMLWNTYNKRMTAHMQLADRRCVGSGLHACVRACVRACVLACAGVLAFFCCLFPWVTAAAAPSPL